MLRYRLNTQNLPGNQVSEEIAPEKTKHRRGLVPFGCLGWALFLIGFAYIIRHSWMHIWDWALLGLGVGFYVKGIIGSDRQYLFPGTILVVTMGAFALRSLGWIDFNLWKFWPILFTSIGLGFVTLWVVRDSRSWVLIPGGIMLFVGGAGFGERSFWRYQYWLRDIVDLWPLILILFGIFLIVGRYRVVEKQ